jgi:hypothetical protein
MLIVTIEQMFKKFLIPMYEPIEKNAVRNVKRPQKKADHA